MEKGLRERGHLESQGRVVFLNFEGFLVRLEQLVGAEHRLVQPGVGNHFLGGGREGAAKAAL